MGYKIKHPYRAALPIGLGLTGLSATVALLAGAISWLDVVDVQAIAWVAGVSASLWLIIIVSTWLVGLWKVRQIKQFLTSDRPLIHWTYTDSEWKALKAARNQEMQGSGTMALGCLTAIFALIGLLTGLMIGLDEDVGAGIVGAIVGTVTGGIAGGVLGLVVSGGNVLAGWIAQQEKQPEHVALGTTEVYANAQYFRTQDSYRYIREVYWKDNGDLIIELWNPKFRQGAEETWTIYVPERIRASVDTVISQVVVDADES